MPSSGSNQNSRQRWEEQRNSMQDEWRLRTNKLKELRRALAIETSTVGKFQLREQKKEEESELNQLEEKLDSIEKKLSKSKGLFNVFQNTTPIEKAVVEEEKPAVEEEKKEQGLEKTTKVIAALGGFSGLVALLGWLGLRSPIPQPTISPTVSTSPIPSPSLSTPSSPNLILNPSPPPTTFQDLPENASRFYIRNECKHPVELTLLYNNKNLFNPEKNWRFETLKLEARKENIIFNTAFSKTLESYADHFYYYATATDNKKITWQGNDLITDSTYLYHMRKENLSKLEVNPSNKEYVLELACNG